ncbi:DNA mismatch repair protein [Bacillus cereus]|uniref:DNA mismatch repair protein n=1 Tax=Bacillus cereus TaxID=1396 RepID=A0A2B2EW73_BACCE|nr:DNA mismatch repair protein [Bacillus cereus]PEX37677.1 DNA mismatch repair protein [Bacillus cereus]PFB13978.1 DNA mismatch repair protein [Bacillus cereus]PFB67607.1 DNA mismatch repair protein [Bacillus cereus]PFC72950.1 DNA mismatch repair protein [Bacillus cereus]PFP60960.1 DNA mismatch repair protein [Bacillus cereus]
MSIEVKKEDIIQHGIDIFRSIGAYHVCNVCINSGNSCCFSCQDLQDGVGCQKRNTACTAWLCGIQGFLFDQIGLLDEWNHFWIEIPGKMFRRDTTPDQIRITSFIDTKKLDSRAGELLAVRLESYVQQGGDIGELERHLSKTYSKY